ncbi:golgin candidate 3-like isoform X3 [Coffea arabica]|uniref:Golgin candidate 3-like isoform X3 n=1 Tax=Coffea arabica TaxID=13443 RepID=A0A6P6VZ94_COFAR|nr:golgin candidate 3-like isoform X3 [Coffea arabica]XP_027115314.1 golgin candidate 3-like isoform X3 [Coffea arabica]
MWSSIANLKENLNKIASDVHHDDEEISGYSSPDRQVNSMSDRRFSHNFANSISPPPTHSPIANGFDSPYHSQIEQCQAEIKRLRESEAEIKALSVNYAALLREKEDQILRLNEENGTLKQNLHATNAALSSSRTTKGSSDQSPNRQSKSMVKNRAVGSISQNGSMPKQDGQSNGIGGADKELIDLLEEKNRALAAFQASRESEVEQLGMELDRERSNSENMKVRLEEEQKLSGSFQLELNSLKVEKDKLASEMTKVRDELSQKISEIRRLQMELHRRDNDETDNMVESLKRTISDLEKENRDLKIKKDELLADLEARRDTSAYKHQSEVQSSEGLPGMEEMKVSFQKLEKDLKETRQEREKALQQLNRLKQHLLDKESEEAEKMDEDVKVIEELRASNDYQKSQILHLEKSLKVALMSQEELKVLYENEIKKSKETIDELNRKLRSCMTMIETKNAEVLNLQTALGQYYAEIEAKERLGEDLTAAKEESARLSGLLKEAYQQADTLRGEKEELVANLSKTERMLAEGKNRVYKLEEDNEKLRRALEHSMTRLNRMSVDSDFLVDRRIVIKLLVTYFQRNHSREVLDLMVRMLGFSDEDKQRIGIAQQGAGKGVVRGVLGFPGRLVGGILGSSSSEASSNMRSDDQSFTDLWVDFLLKETEEREKRESAAASKENQTNGSPSSSNNAPLSNQTAGAATAIPNFGRSSIPQDQNFTTTPPRGTILQSESTNSEFSTVPLSISEPGTQTSRLLPRYS